MTNGKIEALLTANTTWEVSGTDSGGAWGPATVLASGATSYISDLATTLQTVINATATDTHTVTISDGENGTGLVTISKTAGTWSMSFTAGLLQAIGFEANISSVSTAQTGTIQAAGLWLPDCPIISQRQAADAPYVTDLITTVSPRGHVKTMYGNRYRKLSGIMWSHVTEAKTTAVAETTSRASFEQFWIDNVLGAGYSFCTTGAKWRLYWDADSATYFECRPVGFSSFDPQLSEPGWRAYFRIELPELVEVP